MSPGVIPKGNPQNKEKQIFQEKREHLNEGRCGHGARREEKAKSDFKGWLPGKDGGESEFER